MKQRESSIILESDPQDAEGQTADISEELKQTQPKPSASGKLLIVALLSYASISIGIVFYNRFLFYRSIRYPIFISFVQQSTGAIIMWIAYGVGRVVPRLNMFPNTPTLSFRTAIEILPQAFYFVGMIAFSNSCLKYVQVSTYQVARALTLLFNLLLSWYILNDRKSWKVWGACGIVMLGFTVGALDPSTLSLLGIGLGSMSSIFQAMYNVTIKDKLKLVDQNESILMLYNLALSSILFMPVVWFGEDPTWRTTIPFTPSHPDFWLDWAMMTSTGFMAIMYTMASYLCIRITSPVTFNVAGYAKAGLQSIGGILLGDTVTMHSIAGISITMAGSALYGRISYVEGKESRSKIAEMTEPLLQQDNMTLLQSSEDETHNRKITVKV